MTPPGGSTPPPAPMRHLHLDIETYSSVDIKKSGLFKYAESLDFEILMVAWAIGDGPVTVTDLASGEELPDEFWKSFYDPGTAKIAHNAAFERQCFAAIGYPTEVDEWECTLALSAYNGLPLSLAMSASALDLSEEKSTEGRALISYFCQPIKPTKSNNMRHRNMPGHDPDRWERFKTYCAQDVETERAIYVALSDQRLSSFETEVWNLDQSINERGVRIDAPLVAAIRKIDAAREEDLDRNLKELTGLENPNSTAQLRKWLGDALGKNVESVAKSEVLAMIEEVGSGTVKEVLEYRLEAAKSSIKKYDSMEACRGDGDRARGLFQYYGANRTGRWAGRLIQLQNLPQIRMGSEELQTARELARSGDYSLMQMCYPDVSDTLSQLVRTAFIPDEGNVFAVSDFSAIEARVIAWLAGEDWRMEVFRTHGKIYEASASMMYGIPIESIGKDSPERQKGKVAELALGYQGSVGAMKQMGAEAMGLSEQEMQNIVKRWRARSPKIAEMWTAFQQASVAAISRKSSITLRQYQNTRFYYYEGDLRIAMPSGRDLVYKEARLVSDRFGNPGFDFKGMEKGMWTRIQTYGGKLTENIVQALSRDLLALSMVRLARAGFDLVMHVHDEAVAEVPIEGAEQGLEQMYKIMEQPVKWAPGLPLKADGYINSFYKK